MLKRIYQIFNKVAKEPVTDIFVSNNDAIASYGFMSFVSKACKEEMNDKIFELRCIGEYDTESHGLPGVIPQVVCCGREEARNVVANAEEEDLE